MTELMSEITLLLNPSRQGRKDHTALFPLYLHGGRGTLRRTQNLKTSMEGRGRHRFSSRYPNLGTLSARYGVPDRVWSQDL